MKKYTQAEDKPVSEFQIGKNQVEIEGFSVNVLLYYIPSRKSHSFKITQEYEGQSCVSKFEGNLKEVFFECLIDDGIQPNSWQNVDTYKKVFYKNDPKLMSLYRKYIKVKKQFEGLLDEIKHKEKYQHSFWKRDLQNKRKVELQHRVNRSTDETDNHDSR